MSDLTARFSAVRLPLPLFFERLEVALPGCGLRFSGKLWPLQRDTFDFPLVIGNYVTTVSSLAHAAELVPSWWGIGFECNRAVERGDGPRDGFIVNVFPSPEGSWVMHCDELGATEDERIAAGQTTPGIAAVQLAFCEAGGFDVSIYSENDYQWEHVPTLRTVELALASAEADPTYGALSVVVSTELLDPARARRLAGPRADEVRVSPGGYVVLPYCAARGHATR